MSVHDRKMEIWATLDVRYSTRHDVTEAVQILFDMAHSSMDWGSGFLDSEEMRVVIKFAVLMGWQAPDLPGNSPAMQELAREFPEAYEIVVDDNPWYDPTVPKTAFNAYRTEPTRTTIKKKEL